MTLQHHHHRNTKSHPSTRKAKVVRFVSTVRIKEVACRADYSAGESGSYWYSELEMTQMRDGRDRTTHLDTTRLKLGQPLTLHHITLRSGTGGDERSICTGGGCCDIDNTPRERTQRIQFVRDLILAQHVLETTASGRDGGNGTVSEIYHKCSYPAVEHAIAVALENEKDAYNYLHSPSNNDNPGDAEVKEIMATMEHLSVLRTDDGTVETAQDSPIPYATTTVRNDDSGGVTPAEQESEARSTKAGSFVNLLTRVIS